MARGARGRRGRGRGGTRGGTTSQAPDDTHDEETPPVTAEPVSTPPNEPDEKVSVVLPQLSGEQSQQISPNLSPGSPPTETPAPTPARPVAQRLESILPSSGSNTRGTTSRGRFKPRIIRRDQGEREKAGREELARINARQLELQAQGVGTASAASRGAFGRGVARGFARGRGRGDAMGKGRLMASGPFGIAPAAPDKRPMPAIFKSNGDTKSSGGGFGSINTIESGRKTRASAAAPGPSMKVKQEPGLSAMPSLNGIGAPIDLDMDLILTSKVKVDVPEPVYPEENNGGRPAPRVDIEYINMVSDSDDEIIHSTRDKGKGLGSSDKGGLKPVRLHRKEHKDRVTMVNTEPSHAGVADSDNEDKDVMVIEGDSISRPIPSDTKVVDGLRVKVEPGSAVEPMDVDSELRVPSEQIAADSSKLGNSKNKPKSSRTTSMKDKKLVPQTEEEKAEYMRQEEDTRILTDELQNLQTIPGRGPTSGQDDGTEDDHSNGRLYLFQFPPILPPLLNPTKIAEEQDHIQMTGVKTLPLGGTSKASKVTASDPEEAVVIKADPDAPNATQLSSEPFTEAGYIGKLIVRESGKVELDWGGTSLQLSRGSAFDFLTTTMVINDDSGASMGPVMGKFVATPDWDKLFDAE